MDKFNSAKYLVVEANVLDTNPVELQKITLRYAIYEKGKTLKSELPSKLYDKLKNELQKYGLNMALVERQKPWIVAMSLLQLRLQQAKFNPAFGIDMFFLKKAQGTKTILELESVTDQVKLLGSLNSKLQILFLKNIILDKTALETEMKSLLASWELGDTKKIENLMHQSYKENPDLKPLFDKIINKRNKTMTVKVEKYLREGSIYFIIIGAGHLVGKKGIINILRNKKYLIKQL
jgi:uncharacterized protein YbaP (TraB family)